MSYYRVLGMEREPFSTSPDPAFLYLSRRHRAALSKLQISIRLKRGMSVVLGEVGTGKTTLSRRLSQILAADPKVAFQMVLNPHFRTEEQFLKKLVSLFRVPVPEGPVTALDYIEAMERYLFRVAVEEKKTVVLLIDEAQMIPDFVLETLRILLNYETNEHKLLQLVLVGQMELLPKLRGIANFWDRIAMRYMLEPLERAEIGDLVEHRLRAAGYQRPLPLFTSDALDLIADVTRGYPRKMSMLCHNALEYLVMHDDVVVVRDTIEELLAAEPSGGLMPTEPGDLAHVVG